MTTRIEILFAEPIATINRNLYGHFAEHLGNCIEEGFWVGRQSAIPNIDGLRSDVLAALKKLNPPILRWPGGCFADDYHWQDGIGPVESRPRRVNIHWGNTIETNEFGTHEFMALCRAIGAEPYLAGNVGSGTPQELRDWMEYCNQTGGTAWSDQRAQNGAPDPFRVQYWGVGNESWGCGGAFTPAEYAGEYRRYTVFTRSFSDTPPFLIACGPAGNDLAWTEGFFQNLHGHFPDSKIPIHGYAAHYYTGAVGKATEFSDVEWYHLLWKAQQVEKLIVDQWDMMARFDPEHRIGLVIDEWGCWHPATPERNPKFLWQQNTLRDGLAAAITLDIFNRHAEKVIMANIAQTVNVLQSMILTEGDRMILTPTFHIFDLYQRHQGAQAVNVTIEDAPAVTYTFEGETYQLAGLMGSASLKDRVLTLTVVNPHLDQDIEAEIVLQGEAAAKQVRTTVLTHTVPQAHNTFETPESVLLSAPRTEPAGGSTIMHTFGAKSVSRLDIRF